MCAYAVLLQDPGEADLPAPGYGVPAHSQVISTSEQLCHPATRCYPTGYLHSAHCQRVRLCVMAIHLQIVLLLF